MHRILIIDDNRDLADSLGTILEDEGCEVVLAYNGHDGIEAAGEHHFDVLLIDLKLPDMSGVNVLRVIRKKDPQARVIIMTGHRIEQIYEEVTNNGVVEILQPPIEPGLVHDILEQGTAETIVLVADDKPGCAEILSEYLAGRGMDTVVAHNGREAADGVIAGSAGVLVLDMNMPVIYGLEIYLDLKEQGHAVKTIIVTCPAEQDFGREGYLRSAEITGCLYKPFRPEKLLHVIGQITGH